VAKRFRTYSGPRTVTGLPDRRTTAGKQAWARSEASQRGWETRKSREREEREPWRQEREEREYVIEEPIDTVGGKRYKKKGR